MPDEKLPLGAGVMPVEDSSAEGGSMPPTQAPAPRNPLDEIDDDDLSTYILTLLKDDLADKEQSDWKNRRQYDINAYYGVKKPTNFPWNNCSNFPVPLTPTLVDTAHSNLMGSIFFDPKDTCDVEAVGVQNMRKSKDLENFLNWQLFEEIETEKVWDKFVFQSLVSGTGVLKVMKSLKDKSILLEAIPAENIFVPLDAKGFQINETDHVFQIVPLTQNDIEDRKAMGFYKGLEDVPKGFNVRQGSMSEIVTQTKDVAAGTRLDLRQRRDLSYIMECYLTYWCKPKGAPDNAPKTLFELIVWIAPNGGKILAKVENKTGLRPYVEAHPYPRDDRFWGMSLPEKIRPIQEELDYAHNQNINAADIAILPPGFYREGSDFDPEVHKRVPGGMYPVPDPKDVFFQPINVNPIFERQEEKYWDLAERLTGLTELFQGRAPAGRQTATATVRRENRSEIRFKTLYQRYELAWDKMINLIYKYDKLYFEDIKDRVVKVVGVTESEKKVKDLFPDGLEGNYSYKFSSSPITEKELKKQASLEFYELMVANPLVVNDPGNLWRVTKTYAEGLGERNLENIITKPRGAYIASPEEAIQRIMSGELDFVPDPAIDADNYMMRLQLFFRTDAFLGAGPEKQQAFLVLYQRCEALRQGQIRAMLDTAIIHRGPAGQGQPQGGENGQPGAPGKASNGAVPAGAA